MIKLFTLDNISSNSSEALYKICLQLDIYGLSDSNVYQLESYDEIFEEAQTALSAGDYVIIAAENNDFLRYKYEFISKYLLVDSINDQLGAIISKNYYDSTTIDLEAHCTVPQKAMVHASGDGLYSGFSVELLNGLCTVLPLDFGRLDTVIADYIVTFLDPSIGYDPPKIDIDPLADIKKEKMGSAVERSYKESVAKMIYSLVQVDKTIAIANGEAALHIYNLYDRIQGLSDVTSFVEIIDPENGEALLPEAKKEEQPKDDKVEVTHFTPDDLPEFVPVLDENGNPVFDDFGNPVFEAVQKPAEPKPEAPAEAPAQANPGYNFEAPVPQQTEKPKESASAKTIRHAREAMRDMNSSFGAAISDIYSATDENGNPSFFLFVAVGDGKTVKAKKIGTNNPDEAEDLLFHGIIVLAETVCQKIDAISTSMNRARNDKARQDAVEERQQKKTVNPAMIAMTAAIFFVAIIAAVIFANSFVKKPVDPTTTVAPSVISDVSESTSEATTESTTQGVPGLDNTTAVPGAADGTTEPTAGNVTAAQTSAAVASTSGTFTFYVYGYGHGVGLSQNGAKYYAETLHWNYAQILANYFYGTTLMTGDTYPNTISYNNTDYNTEDFIACALEAEMGSSYPEAALKAQAVAIYTFAKYYNYKLDTTSMAYNPSPSQACKDAAAFVKTNGLYIAYGGQTALTPFFSTSAGVTTSYYNVWGGTAVNYLAGGRPSYGDYNADQYKTTVTLTSQELKALIEGSDSSISLSGDPSTWISIITHDAAVSDQVGYVSTIRVGGKEFSGNDFRQKLMGGKLRSHCFTFTYTPTA